MNSIGPYAQGAPIYRELGWQGVIPADLAGKPGVVPSGYTGRNGAWPSDEQVTSWISWEGENGIGLRVPNDVLGIDVDAYDGKCGAKTIEMTEGMFGALPPTWRSTARRADGDLASGIYLYRVPPGVQWVSDLGEGSNVEIVQTAHRWIRVWPSVNLKTGKVYGKIYRWYKPEGPLGSLVESDRPPKIDELAALPDEWVYALTRRDGSADLAGGSDRDGDGQPFDWKRALTPDAVGSGDQEDTLWRAARSLRAQGVSDRFALQQLERVIDCFTNHRADNPWTYDYAHDKWKNAKKLPDGPEVTPGQRALAKSVAEHDRNPLGFAPLSRITGERPKWLIREFLLADAFGVIGGPEKSLKSYAVTAVTLAVASGKPLFCDDQFPVPQRRRVLVLTGEGSAQLFRERLEHLCGLCEIDFADVQEWVEVTDTIELTSSEVFREGLGRRIEDFDPGLIVVDPAYVYLDPGEGGAGNVFTMGKLLADLRELRRGRATLVCHHTTKAGADTLSLSSLTQAGFREIVDHWLLMTHAAEPNLQDQRFKLKVKCGARRGFGWDGIFEVTLGPLDLDTLRHVGDPAWRVLRGAEAQDDDQEGPRFWRRQVLREIHDAPWTKTASNLTTDCKGDSPGSRRNALKWLREKSLVRAESRKGPNGERALDRFGPTLDLAGVDVDELLRRKEDE